MKQLLHTLSRTDQPSWSYIWKAALISIIPTLVISIVVGLAMPTSRPSLGSSVATVLLGLVFLAPWMETFLMLPVLWILKRLLHRQLLVALASAATWAVIHSLSAAAWGLAVAWPFFVFSTCFLEWQKQSRAKAIVITASVHMCHNVLPAFLLILSR